MRELIYKEFLSMLQTGRNGRNYIQRVKYSQEIQDPIDLMAQIHMEINNKPISLFSAFPFIVRAFDPVIDAQTLQFEYNPQNNTFVDTQTGSEWNFEGVSIAGQLQGKQLD